MVCRVPGKYANLDGVLYVAGAVIMAKVPQPHVPQPKEPDAPATGCGEGEVLWHSWISYFKGEFFQNGEMTVEEWDKLESNGYFDDSAEDGQTWTITGTYCGPSLPDDY